jgi:hypothetical protein
MRRAWETLCCGEDCMCGPIYGPQDFEYEHVLVEDKKGEYVSIAIR